MKTCRFTDECIEGKVDLSAPIFSFYHKVAGLFEDDPDFEVGPIDEETYEFTVMVHNQRKCDIFCKAITIPKMIRDKIRMNVECDVDDGNVSEADLAYMLNTNPYFSDVMTSDDSLMSAVLMEPVVVQYYNDVFNNPYGIETKTAELLARELFKKTHCNITSDVFDFDDLEEK